MQYVPSVLLVDPKKDKELAKKLKKAGISKSEFHRRNTDAFLKGSVVITNPQLAWKMKVSKKK